jgi:aminoglycoside phosphotransferase (APT) family kinase protein
MARMHDDEVETDVALVGRLLAAQFPHWADLPVSAVDSAGTDNAMYRLGDELAVRLPRIAWAVGPVQREYQWLPRLAPSLPVEVPLPLALGAPGEGYAWPWTVCRWVPGVHPSVGLGGDTGSMSADTGAGAAGERRLARDLAAFVRAMRDLDPAEAPTTAWPRPLRDEDAFARTNADLLADELGPSHEVVLELWQEAITAPGPESRQWIHGDLSPGNVLMRDGRLAAVLDFGAMGLGDPASDHRIAWNLLTPDARAVFRAEVGADDETWARSRGWALLQALAQLPYYAARNPPLAANARRVIAELVAERS